VAVLVDTGPLLALADADDPHHQAVSQWIEETLEVLLVPVTVLPEADYLLASRLGADVALAMLRSVAAGELQLEPLTAADLERAIALIAQYADSNIGFVDASIAAIAERLRVTRILTLDHRHFRLLRPRHCDAFELLPSAI
jgi:uncharacterized protein